MQGDGRPNEGGRRPAEGKGCPTQGGRCPTLREGLGATGETLRPIRGQVGAG